MTMATGGICDRSGQKPKLVLGQACNRDGFEQARGTDQFDHARRLSTGLHAGLLERL